MLPKVFNFAMGYGTINYILLWRANH